jgi:hypothetical protein
MKLLKVRYFTQNCFEQKCVHRLRRLAQIVLMALFRIRIQIVYVPSADYAD